MRNWVGTRLQARDCTPAKRRPLLGGGGPIVPYAPPRRDLRAAEVREPVARDR